MQVKNIYLELESRRKIYSSILSNPGIHFSELCRKLGFPKTTLFYHLNYMKKRNLIKENKIDNHSRYYISNKIGVRDKKFFNLIRKEIYRNRTSLTIHFMLQFHKRTHSYFLHQEPREKLLHTKQIVKVVEAEAKIVKLKLR